MSFLGKAWKIIVGIKDGLVLVFMLLFFVALFSILSASPNPGQVRDGALLIDMTGFVVEEKSKVDPLDTLMSGRAPPVEIRARDLVRALDAAASDERVKAVVMDLTAFVGGGQVHMQEVADAMDRVRKAQKPVLTYALAYGDDHIHLASHASEVWVNPMGGAMIAGPGRVRLYYADLLEQLKVNVRVYRVGTFKSAVEPYILDGPSPASQENMAALFGSMWEEWQANVKKARPEFDLDQVVNDPVAWVEGASGDLAEAALSAGMVDKLGSRVEFGQHVASIVGEDAYDEKPGTFAKSDFGAYLADIGPARESSSNQIAVVTIAGTIVDGDAGPGTAGGERIVGLLDRALAKEEIKGLVVRVDSPGGSALASEDIRQAIERYRADKDVPVAVSFANLAASGGYWVATKADRIFAQPETITGSIGVFGVVPTFENLAAELGVSSDGYRTTPLTGQPDLVAGLPEEVDTILQTGVENTYSDFLTIVSEARGMSTDKVDAIAQGRVWDGGTARQLGLVDQFGGLEEALQWVAGEAGLEEGDWAPTFLMSETGGYDTLIQQFVASVVAPAPEIHGGDMFAVTARQRELVLGQLAHDVKMLSGTNGVQAYCLECPSDMRPVSSSDTISVGQVIGAWLAR